MENNIGIVLIHGAGLGNYIWQEMNQYLTAPILAVEFPNRDAGDKANKNLLFEDYLNSAIEQIENWGINKFIIITHSIGGGIALKLNDHFKESVNGFIGISAIIPKKNQSFTSCFPFPQKLILPVLLKLFGTKPPAQSIANELCNDLEQAQTDEVVKKFSPESVKLYTAKIDYNSFPKNSLFIKLLKDKSIPPNMQNEMIKNLNCNNVVELNSGHLPMMSEPKALAKIINGYLGK